MQIIHHLLHLLLEPLHVLYPISSFIFQRMTPFWRTVGSKPLGAYCNQGLECTTKICRYSRWCILT
uniref:Uncharacterized protein n=1 Tax=Xenopus tropicalis TaxID=8364 RepID=A0A6I8S469_XENTR